MGHWLADVHLAAFSPAYTVSLCDSEAPANRQMPIASVVRRQCRKKEKSEITVFSIINFIKPEL